MEKNQPPPSYNQPPPVYNQPAQYGYAQPTYPQVQSTSYGGGNPNMMMANTSIVMPGQAQPPPTTIIQTQRTQQSGCCSGESPNLNSSGARTAGIIQLVGGVLTIIFIAVSIGEQSYFYAVPGLGASIGAAIFFYIPTGILGICAYNKSTCVLVAYLVMCILTTIEAFSMTCYEGFAAVYFSFDGYYGVSGVVQAMHALACAIALVEFITAIVGAVFCCSGMGGSTTPSTTVVHAQTGVPGVVFTN